MVTSSLPAAWSTKLVVGGTPHPCFWSGSWFSWSRLPPSHLWQSNQCLSWGTLLPGMVLRRDIVHDGWAMHFQHWVFLSCPSILLLLQCLNISLESPFLSLHTSLCHSCIHTPKNLARDLVHHSCGFHLSIWCTSILLSVMWDFIDITTLWQWKTQLKGSDTPSCKVE